MPAPSLVNAFFRPRHSRNKTRTEMCLAADCCNRRRTFLLCYHSMHPLLIRLLGCGAYSLLDRHPTASSCNLVMEAADSSQTLQTTKPLMTNYRRENLQSEIYIYAYTYTHRVTTEHTGTGFNASGRDAKRCPVRISAVAQTVLRFSYFTSARPENSREST